VSPSKKASKFNRDFSIFADLQKKNGRKGEEIFYTFLNRVYDSPEQEIYDYLPIYLRDLTKEGVLSSESMAKGTTRFIRVLPDLTSDVPKLSNYFAHTLLALLDCKAFEPTDLEWIEPKAAGAEGEEDDEMVFVESYYKAMADFLALHQQKNGSWKNTVQYY